MLKGPSTHNQKRSSIFFIVKFSKLLDKKRIPITVREKSQQNNKKRGPPVRLTDFPDETPQARRQWHGTFNVLKK